MTEAELIDAEHRSESSRRLIQLLADHLQTEHEEGCNLISNLLICIEQLQRDIDRLIDLARRSARP